MVSIKDIAKAIGVSPSSVSLVLNGKSKQKRISDELANKIMETATKMGYKPNRIAVGLRTGRSKTIGLIVENISNHFFSTLAKIIEDELRTYGYNVVYCSTENDVLKGQEMIQMLYHQQVDGYLITPANGMKTEIDNLIQHSKPVVLMDRVLDNLDVPYVLVDNYAGMKEGMLHLIHKGYKHIGFVTVDLELQQVIQRQKAYEDAHDENGLRWSKVNILKVKYSNTKEQAVAAISTFIQSRKNLDVIVFATNYLGIYGLQSIKQIGLHIPNDIGMLCFDDHDIFDLYEPGITVIEQPIRDIAKKAVDILITALGHKHVTTEQHVLLHTKLIKRASE